ncbi:unnamed protein product [Coffea canephora]|uniref:Uncharacterized protein n=1 Tax=Coffea canephora TaxID=49390 RepID=A0A068U898_COFCA|nr:unnamed protein product [Coffea canephora]
MADAPNNVRISVDLEDMMISFFFFESKIRFFFLELRPDLEERKQGDKKQSALENTGKLMAFFFFFSEFNFCSNAA